LNWSSEIGDDVLGDRGTHRAFILPTDCPQAPPSAFKIVQEMPFNKPAKRR
jgi:hypothetical protein